MQARNERKLRTVSLALLCLIAHALFVNLTHHHPIARATPGLATAPFTAADTSGSNPAPDSGSDAHCLSCLLQRHFVSPTYPVPVLLGLIDAPTRYVTFPTHSNSRLISANHFGRAPPRG